ncbi:MAG: VCBS repeat-containing protein, partial [Gammaproteobacteria bacterium]
MTRSQAAKLLLTWAFCFAWGGSLAQPEFSPDSYQQVAEARGLGGITGYGRGASFVDVDGDGDDDLFVADTDGRLFGAPYGLSLIYTNDGSGNFIPGEFNLDPADFHGTWAASFADFDNDGDQDMMVANGGYTNRSTLELLENRINQGQGFVNVSVSAGIRSATVPAATHSWWGVSWADYDNDGWLDAVVTRRDERPLLFHNERDGSFSERAAAMGLGEYGQSDAKNPVWIDYDGDGDQDLYIAGMDWHGFFRNDGDRFTEVSHQVFPQALPGHSGLPAVFAAATADFDQDGREDIYLGRWDSQDLILFNDGDGTFSPVGRENGIDTINHEKVSESDTNPMSNQAANQRRQDRASNANGVEVDMAPFE